MKNFKEKIEKIIEEAMSDGAFWKGNEKSKAKYAKYDRDERIDQILFLIASVVKEAKEKKSVEELKDIMGDAYKDLSVQVAYKEGFNIAFDRYEDNLLEILGKGKE